MPLFITRHGETIWNEQKKICGRSDVELTERGIAQAKRLAEKVKGQGITRMLVSPLHRARVTAELANTYIQVPMEIDERLIEHNFGIYEGRNCDDAEFQAAKRNVTCRYPKGESVLDVAHRAYSLLDEIPEKYPGETVLLVCHGTFSRVVHTYFENIALEDFMYYSLDNCELKKYEYPKKRI